MSHSDGKDVVRHGQDPSLVVHVRLHGHRTLEELKAQMSDARSAVAQDGKQEGMRRTRKTTKEINQKTARYLATLKSKPGSEHKSGRSPLEYPCCPSHISRSMTNA